MGRSLITIWVITAIVLIAIIGVPIGGFIFGIVHSEGPGNPLPVGIVYALLTSMFLGFPPKNEGSPSDTYDVWPYIIGTDLTLLIILAIASTAIWADSVRRRNRPKV